jgi:putative nucleotidyltransferase with HDIG domain
MDRTGKNRFPAAVYPDSGWCLRLLDEEGVPDNIRRHSQTVARVSSRLVADVRRHSSSRPDPSLVETAALLHDIAKHRSLVNPGLDHAREGGRILRDLGLTEVAAVIERHVTLGPWSKSDPITEAEIVNYSDKRVLHQSVVTLEERFVDLMERYGPVQPSLEGRIRKNWEIMLGVEEKIFRDLPFAPGDVR